MNGQMRWTGALSVYLEDKEVTTHKPQDVFVGTLSSNQVYTRFEFAREYIDLGPRRPVLSAAFWNPRDEVKTRARLEQNRYGRVATGRLPPFFRELLPEGELCSVIERQMGLYDVQPVELLAYLGFDLPGAVKVCEPQSNPLQSTVNRDVADVAATDVISVQGISSKLRFSIAGVQLKLSMSKTKDGRFVVPAKDSYGRYLVKLPSLDIRFPRLPELEYTSMKLAEAAGVEIAEVELRPIGQIDLEGNTVISGDQNALVVKRFDREGERRIHIEDFAQIVGDGRDKYRCNEETVVSIAERFCQKSVESALRAVARIVVNILLGNGDAHLKNWSLIYRGGSVASLSPAYDIVPTVCYPVPDEMALRFVGSRRFEAIDVDRFKRLAEKARLNPKVVVQTMNETIDRAISEWPRIIRQLPISKSERISLKEHWDRLSIVPRGANPFDVSRV